MKAEQEHAGDARDEDDAPDDNETGDETDDRATADERSAASPPSQLWLVAACLCLLAAAALWLLDHADAAFVVAALGVISWFLNVRVRLRQKNSREDTEARRDEDEEEA